MMYFFFNDTATTEIYTLSLHDALPISARRGRAVEALLRRRRHARQDDHVEHGGARARRAGARPGLPDRRRAALHGHERDRKSTRLNSSHANISYAVFCLKKKKFALKRP